METVSIVVGRGSGIGWTEAGIGLE